MNWMVLAFLIAYVISWVGVDCAASMSQTAADLFGDDDVEALCLAMKIHDKDVSADFPSS